MNLVPSVTTILNIAAKPALLAWMQQQVLYAALTLPRRPDEPEKEYIDRIINDSKEQGRSAADAGTDIHASIQGHYEGKTTGKRSEETKQKMRKSKSEQHKANMRKSKSPEHIAAILAAKAKKKLQNNQD
jgi:hypothetical protein